MLSSFYANFSCGSLSKVDTRMPLGMSWNSEEQNVLSDLGKTSWDLTAGKCPNHANCLELSIMQADGSVIKVHVTKEQIAKINPKEINPYYYYYLLKNL